MSTDRDTARIVRSWLSEDGSEDASHILGSVLDVLDTTPQRRATWWPARRTTSMNKLVVIGLGAAAVIVALLIGSRLIGPPTSSVGGPPVEPTPNPTPSAVVPTATPQPSVAQPSAEASDLDEGPHALMRGTGFEVGITVTIPAPGWFADSQGGILTKSDTGADPPDGSGLIVFPEGGEWYVPSDPCSWSSTLPDTPATTVAELATWLTAQGNRGAWSVPTDVTLAGYAGVSLYTQVPDDAVFEDCDGAQFCMLVRDPGSRSGGCWRFHQGPGQIDKLWIVDVNGTSVIFDAAWYEETPPEHIAELERIVQSATFTFQ